MHIFTPGAVARAEEVNDNFRELKETLDSNNYTVINGKKYRSSGSWQLSGHISSWLTYGSVYCATIRLAVPYTPPAGYTFEVFTLETKGYNIVQTCNVSSGQVHIRVMQIQNNDKTALRHIGWRLTAL